MSLTKATYSMIKGASANVLDYGADPTGVADSTTAIQAAIDANLSEVFLPDGVYKITSTLSIDNKWGFGFTGSPSNKRVELIWAGSSGGKMMQVTKSRQVVVHGITLNGDNIAATTLEILSGVGNTNTQQQYVNCLFQNVTGSSVLLNGNNLQLDMIYFKSCWWSVCDIGMEINGASTFMIYVQGGTLGDFDSYGFYGKTGGQLYISDMGFIRGGTPGDPTPAGMWCVARKNTFGEIVIENVQFEGNAKFFNAEDSSGFSNFVPATIRNCQVGPTGGGTYSVIDYRQKGALIIEGGAFGGSYGTVDIYYENPGNPQTGGYLYINGTKLDSVTVTTSGNSYVNGFAETGTQYAGNGLKFPATQISQTDANTIDDYEEGSWTPTFTNLTVVGDLTATGKYIKVGKKVYAEMRISSTTTTASTAGTTFSTLPIPQSTNSTCAAVNYSTKASYGVGAVGLGDDRCYTPTWPAVQDVVVSFTYEASS